MLGMGKRVTSIGKRDLRIIWNKNVSGVAYKEIWKRLEGLLTLLPDWVSEIQIHCYTDGRPDLAAKMIVDYEYRRCDLTVTPEWLNGYGPEKRLQLIHEICHVINGPLYRFAHALIQDAVEVGVGRRVAEEELRMRSEAVTSDLTEILARLA